MDVIPGNRDLFFRRFMMGVQLAGLLLAGRGGGWLADRGVGVWESRVRRWHPEWSKPLLLVAAVAVLAPALAAAGGAMSAWTGAAITVQRQNDTTAGVQLDRLIAVITHDGGGRTYAGMPSNWGASFTVGAVPVFKYLESRDVDEVGYTLRTASLMTDPEFSFDQQNPSDYRLFAIRFLLLPAGMSPPVSARLVMRSGPLHAVDSDRHGLHPGRTDRR